MRARLPELLPAMNGGELAGLNKYYPSHSRRGGSTRQKIKKKEKKKNAVDQLQTKGKNVKVQYSLTTTAVDL